MEVSQMMYPPDPLLIDTIVGQLKSQGIFDQFRKECIADVDTKPAYQNLQQRVETTVSNFLEGKTWCPDLNKNQLRDSLRKHIHEMGFLEAGVERIVDQVVNPKVYTVFMPQVEDVVYSVQGIPKPDKRHTPPPSSSARSGGSTNKNAGMLFSQPPPFLPGHAFLPPVLQNHMQKSTPTLEDLLPEDLDPVSPESGKESPGIEEHSRDDERNDNDPETHKSAIVKEHDDSLDSQLSGFSDLTSHGSEHATTPTPKLDKNAECEEFADEDSHLSKVSSGSRLSFISSDDKSQDPNEGLIKEEVPTSADDYVNSSPKDSCIQKSPKQSPQEVEECVITTSQSSVLQDAPACPISLEMLEVVPSNGVKEEEVSTEVVDFTQTDYSSVSDVKEGPVLDREISSTEKENNTNYSISKVEDSDGPEPVFVKTEEVEKSVNIIVDESSLAAMSEDSQSSGASDNKLHIDEMKEMNSDNSNQVEEHRVLNDNSTSVKDPQECIDPAGTTEGVVETSEEARHGFDDSQDAVQQPPLPPPPPPAPPEDSRSAGSNGYSPIPKTPGRDQWSPEDNKKQVPIETSSIECLPQNETNVLIESTSIETHTAQPGQHVNRDLDLDEISGSDSESMQLAWSPLSVHGDKEENDAVDPGFIETESGIGCPGNKSTAQAMHDQCKSKEMKEQTPDRSREYKKDDRHRSSDKHRDDRHDRHREREKSKDDKSKERRKDDERSHKEQSSSSSRRHDEKLSKSKENRERNDSTSRSRHDEKSRSDRDRSSSHHKSEDKKKDEKKDDRDKGSSSHKSHKSSRTDDRHRHDKDRDRKASTSSSSRHEDKDRSSSTKTEEKSRSSKTHSNDRDRDRDRKDRDRSDRKSEKDRDRKDRDRKHEKEKENRTDKDSSRHAEKRREKDRERERKEKSTDACRQNYERRSTDRDSNNGSTSAGNSQGGSESASGTQPSYEDTKDDRNKRSSSSGSDSKSSSSGQNQADNVLIMPSSPVTSAPAPNQTASVSPPSSLPFKKRPLLPEKNESENPEVFSCFNSNGRLVLKIKKPKLSHDKKSRKALKSLWGVENAVSSVDKEEYQSKRKEVGSYKHGEPVVPDIKFFPLDWPMKAEGERFLSFIQRLERSKDLSELSDSSSSDTEAEEEVHCPYLDEDFTEIEGQTMKLTLQLLTEEAAQRLQNSQFVKGSQNTSKTSVRGLKGKNKTRQSASVFEHSSDLKRRKGSDTQALSTTGTQKSRRERKPNKRYSSEEFTSTFDCNEDEDDDEDEPMEPCKIQNKPEPIKKEKVSVPPVLPTIKELSEQKSTVSDAVRRPSCSWSADPYLSNSEDEADETVATDSDMIGTALKNLMMESGLGGPEEASGQRKQSDPVNEPPNMPSKTNAESEKRARPLSGVKRVGLSRNYKGGAGICRMAPAPAVITANGFSLPLSPESDVSASSTEKGTCGKSNKAESVVDVITNGFSSGATKRFEQSRVKQHYDSDDLYKPRPLFSVSSRRRQMGSRSAVD